MLLVHRHRRGERDLEVAIHDPDATVADLCRALSPERPVAALSIDGRTVAASTPLDRAALGDGSIVRRVDDPEPQGPDHGDSTLVLEVIAGLDTGRVHPLAPGRHLLGRPVDPVPPEAPPHRSGTAPRRMGPKVASGREDGGSPSAPELLPVLDPTVSRRQAELLVDDGGEVRIVPGPTTNPTLLDGVPLWEETIWPPGSILRCGGARLRLGTPEVAPPPRDALDGPPPWTLHRLPEVTPPPPPPAVPLPAEDDHLPSVTPVGVAAVIGSLLLAGVLVIVLGNWMYAIFAGLGPVLALASAIDSRRRRRSISKRNRRRRRADLEAFDLALLSRVASDRTALEARLTSAAGAARSASAGPGGREPDPRCWSRRLDDPDARTVRLGRGTIRRAAPVDGDPARAPEDLRRLIERGSLLPGAPVPLPLEPGRPVALVGDPAACRAVARSLVVQAAVLHGPADLRIGVSTADRLADLWTWARWLPHTRGPGGTRLIGTDEAGRMHIAAALTPEPPDPHIVTSSEQVPDGPLALVVLDDAEGLSARRSPGRTLLRLGLEPISAVIPLVIVDDGPVPPGALVARIGAGGRVEIRDGAALSDVHADGMAPDTAAHAARSLSRVADAEVDDADLRLPARVELADLLGAERLGVGALTARWRAGGSDPAPVAVLGSGTDGPCLVDLAADGPHALVAGTTGAGKSELLRSLVVSLAVGSSPDHLTFVLIDFKGGSAFDACARLPHTTGLVTDLDEHLAARALRCLEAELRHRERRLRAAGVSDLTEFRHRPEAQPDDEPLPRLVVVIDEFATLAAELPDFVDSLVGIAQRGRSLGVHLVLATQRPTGAVNDNIRANTALRIALRVQDRADSDDVIGTPEAAALPRDRPGRALVRFGPGELLTVQGAYAGGDGLSTPRPPVTVRPLGTRPRSDSVGDRQRTAESADPPGRAERAGPIDRGRTDLDELVDRLGRAWRIVGGRRPRAAWPDPLPEILPGPLADPRGSTDSLLLGAVDDPDEQRHVPYRWNLDGPLLAVGLPGSGTRTVAAGAVLAACRRWNARDLHVHVLDCGDGSLGALGGLPQVGAVVHVEETERQRRLLEHLTAHLGSRSSDAPAATRRLVVVHGLGAFHDRWGDRQDGPWPMLCELARRGADAGVHLLLTAEGAGRAPHQIVTACRHRLLLRLGDRSDHAAFGLAPSEVPDLVPDRGIDPEGPRLVQIARPERGLAAEVAALAAAGLGCDRSDESDEGGRPRAPKASERPLPIGVLPRSLHLDQLAASGRATAVDRADGTLSLMVGVSDHRLLVAHLVLPPGGHGLIAGPPRSGRSTTLRTLARAASVLDRPVLWVTVDGDASTTGSAGSEADTADPVPEGVISVPSDRLADRVRDLEPMLVLVDDADRLADDSELTSLVTERRPDRHVVVTARADRLRGTWSPWSREIRADRTGILLDPDRDLDGDLLGVRLPRELPVTPRPGLAWLSGEPAGHAQIAVSDI